MALRTVDSPMSKISKGRSLTKKRVAQLRKKSGGSNIGEYKGVAEKDFAGTIPGTFPINTRKRAIAALGYARHDKNPGRVRAKVYAKYPSLKHSKQEK